MTASDTVTKKEAKSVLERMKQGGKHTLAEEAQQLGLSYTRPLKQALVELCGGQEGYQKLMAGRKYPRKTKEERAALREQRRAKDEEPGGDVARLARAAGVRVVVKKKEAKRVVAPVKKKEAGVVEIDDGSAAAEGTDDDDDGGGTEKEDDDGGGTDDEEAEVADCVDAMGGKGWDWANEYWGAGSSGDIQAEANATGKAPGLL